MHQERGHTLVEMILYSAFTIGGLLLAGMFMLSVIRSEEQFQHISDIAENGSFAMEHMASALRSSAIVYEPSATSSGSVLSFYDSVTAQRATIQVENNQLVEHIASSSFPLTSSAVTVTQLQFTRISTVGEKAAVQIVLTLGVPVDQTGSADLHEQFITSIVSRQ